MTQTVVNAKDARDNFSEILGRVKFGQEIVTIEKKGKPYAVMMSPQQYEAFQKEARKRFGDVLKRMQSQSSQSAHSSEEEIMADVNREVEAVRKELYEAGE